MSALDPHPHVLRLAGCQVDASQQIVLRADRRVHLSTRENELLVYLWDNPGRTITREELLEQVWGYPRHGSTEPIYSTVKRLRAKIEGPGPHRHIVTVPGEGYRFEPPPAPAAPTPPSPRPAAHTLARVARTHFVGREAELGAITRRFDEGARLVTLLGPGGVGKTRVAREFQRTRAGGARQAWFCDLSDARDADELLRAVAGALDLPLDGDELGASIRGIGRALAAASPAFLILDNVEQLRADAGPIVTGWLDHVPLLVTSRERLGVAGEHVVELGPLPEDEAIELFVDRARMATGRFEVVDAHRADVVRAIVNRLDRLPLAIELAAARTPLLGPEALLARLDQQLDVLARHTVDGAARHATLRATVDWSWRLLTDAERRTLAQCSIFAGGFTLEAAEAVVVVGGGPSAVFDQLVRLRDRSLIRSREIADLPEQARLGLYAAVQQFASERRRESEALALRHARWAADEGERWLADLDGRGHTRARAHLEVELDNLRAAFAWAVDSAPEVAARLARVLDALLRLRGGAVARQEVLERALTVAPDEAGRARLALALGQVLEERGRDGAGHLEQARALAAGAGGLIAVEAAAEARLGQGLASRGELDRGVVLIEGALARARGAGERRLEGRVLGALGEVLWRGGRVPAARDALEAALAIHYEVGDLRFAARTSATLCHVLRADGRLAEAFALLDEAERTFAELGDAAGAIQTQVDRGLHLSRVGRSRSAVTVLEQAGAAFARLGLLRGRVDVHLNLAEALLGLGEDARALAEVHRAVALCREVGERLRLSTALELLACAALLHGDVAGAEGALEEALAIGRGAGNRRSEATLLSKRGLCRLLRSRWSDSLEDFLASERLHRERGAFGMEGTATANRAVALAALGRDDEARQAAERARELLGDPPDTRWTGRMLTLLEAAGEALRRLGRGEPPAAVRADAERARAAVLAHLSPDAQDLATRLSCLLLDHAVAAPPPPTPG